MSISLSRDGKQLRLTRSGARSRVWGRFVIASCWLLALLSVPFVALWLVNGGI